jgi:ADP-ribose pyrophosphatase YjhB (NUDIX family)
MNLNFSLKELFTMLYNQRMNSADRFRFLVAVHAFFLKDDQVLLLKRLNTGYMDGYFSVPAGHVDGGESIWRAMQREIQEETTLLIQEKHQPIHVMHRTQKNEERIDYFFLIKNWQGQPQVGEPEKCASLEWFNCVSLPTNMIPYITFALEAVQKGVLFSEFEEKKMQ